MVVEKITETKKGTPVVVMKKSGPAPRSPGTPATEKRRKVVVGASVLAKQAAREENLDPEEKRTADEEPSGRREVEKSTRLSRAFTRGNSRSQGVTREKNEYLDRMRILREQREEYLDIWRRTSKGYSTPGPYVPPVIDWKAKGMANSTSDVQHHPTRMAVEASMVKWSSREIPLKMSTLAKLLSVRVKSSDVSVLPVFPALVQIPSRKAQEEHQPAFEKRFSEDYYHHQTVHVLVDTGSSDTYIRQDVANKFRLKPIARALLNRSTISGDQEKVEFSVVRLNLASMCENYVVQTNALVAPRLVTIPEFQVTLPRELSERTKQGQLYSLGVDQQIGILLGVDALPNIIKGEIFSTGNLAVIPSHFGPLILGTARNQVGTRFEDSVAGTAPAGRDVVNKQQSRSDQEEKVASKVQQSEPTPTSSPSRVQEDLSDKLERHWQLESIGIAPVKPEEDDVMTEEELLAMRRLEQGTVYENQRYTVPLLWRDDKRPVNNYTMALRRMESKENELLKDKNKEVRSGYNAELLKLIDSGTVIEIDQDAAKDPECFFLPHRPVVKQESVTTKIRPVFDASARDRTKVSLNERLLPGPKSHAELPGIILRFRRGPVIICMDIKKMFHMFHTKKKDRRFQRFLWRFCDKNVEPRIFEFICVVFGFTDSPFKAIHTTKTHVEKYKQKYPTTVESALQNAFVDDIITAWLTVEEARRFVDELQAIMGEASLELYKMVTNSAELLEDIPEERRGKQAPLSFVEYPAMDETSEKEGTSSALGVQYDPKSDLFSYFGYERVKDQRILTKRTIASQMAKVWDPMGFLSPFNIRAKIIVRECHKEGVEWDKCPSEDILASWKAWLAELPMLEKLSIPRNVWNLGKPVEEQLHIMTDASQQAMCACAYVRKRFEDGTIAVHLEMAKTKLAPLKVQTLPRLELIAALMGARLNIYVCNELEMDPSKTYFWSDSMTALQWINKSPSSWKVFVSHRVKEIQELSDVVQWSHVPGVENPSDLGTRGVTIEEMLETSAWLSGPEWMWGGKEDWPTPMVNPTLTSEAQLDEQKVSVTATAIRRAPTGELVVEQLLARYTDTAFHRLIRTLALVRRAVRKFCALLEKRESRRPNTRSRSKAKIAKAPACFMVSSNEFMETVCFALVSVQREYFSKEYTLLQGGAEVAELAKSSQLVGLNPYYDEKLRLIRARTRLVGNPMLTEWETKPIVVPNYKSKFTRMLILYYHITNSHAPQMWTRSYMKEMFHLLHPRRSVQVALRECDRCKRENAKPAAQQMGDLPLDRHDMGRVWEAVGMDLAGPFKVDMHNEDDTTYRKKCWVVVYTCFTSRGVIFDFIPDMTADTVIMSLRRLCARRGTPRSIYSDCAKNFLKAEKELQELWDHVNAKILENAELQKIEWHFISPHAPWQGGVWESMVKLLKTSMKRVLGSRILTQMELVTTLMELEQQVNSRPLTAESSSVGYETVSPAKLLYGYQHGTMPEQATFPRSKATAPMLRWKLRQEVATHFWNVWKKTYLEHLKTRAKWHEAKPNLKVGQVVLYHVDKQPRAKWPLAVVQEIRLGRDDKVRRVVLKTKSGLVERAVQSVYPLEQSLIQDEESLKPIEESE